MSDERVLKLKEVIFKKKEEMGKARRFSPKTSCIFIWNGKSININVLKENELNFYLIYWNMFKMSMNNLGIKEFEISGYDIEDWISDIIERREMLKQKNKQKELFALEKKLDQLLSENAKKELELDSIEDLLK